VFAVLNIKVIR